LHPDGALLLVASISTLRKSGLSIRSDDRKDGEMTTADDTKQPAVEVHWRYKPDQVRYEALLRAIFNPVAGDANQATVQRWRAQLALAAVGVDDLAERREPRT